MKFPRTARVLLILLYCCFLTFWAWSGAHLPDRVATHFDLNGAPNGWMSRSANQAFMLIFGLSFPLFIVLICWATRFMPAAIINVPHREYWLAPERKRETSDYLLRLSFWFACLAVGFVSGIQYSILNANQQAVPHLSPAVLWWVVGPFLAGTGLWALVLVRHFRRV